MNPNMMTPYSNGGMGQPDPLQLFLQLLQGFAFQSNLGGGAVSSAPFGQSGSAFSGGGTGGSGSGGGVGFNGTTGISNFGIGNGRA